MKVLVLIDSLVTGGAERLVVSFAEAAHGRDDLNVVVATFDNATTPFRERLTAGGVEVVDFPGTSLVDPGRAWRLSRFIRRGHFDVVHAHLASATVIGAAACRLAGVPFVVTAHNTQPSVARMSTSRRRLLNWALRSPSTRRIAVGEAVAQANRAEHGVDFAVIPNATPAHAAPQNFDRSAFRASLGAHDEECLFLAIGLICRQKAYEDMIEALARCPEGRLAVAGGAPEPDRMAALRARADALGLSGRIAWLGERRDVPALLTACDVLLSASHWEGAPVSLLEAMAAGRAVCVTDVGDNAKVLDGLVDDLPAAGDLDGLAARMRALAREPASRAALGESCRLRAAQHYGVDVWINRHLDAYRTVTGRIEAHAA